MSVETDSTNDSIESDEEPDWEVESGQFRLAKVGYNDYQLEFDAYSVGFRDVRDHEDGYELRNRKSRTIGVFEPSDDSVPLSIATAFTILAEEL